MSVQLRPQDSFANIERLPSESDGLMDVFHKNTIIIPNVEDTYIFGGKDRETGLPDGVVASVRHYGARYAIICGEKHKLIVPNDALEIVRQIADFNEGLGASSLPPGNIIGVDVRENESIAAAVLREIRTASGGVSNTVADTIQGAEHLSFFTPTPETDEISRLSGVETDRHADSVLGLDHKCRIAETLQERGAINVPAGGNAYSIREAWEIFEHNDWGPDGGAVIRPLSAAGEGIQRFHNVNDFTQIIENPSFADHLEGTDPIGLRIVKWFPANTIKASPGVVVYVDGDRTVLWSMSEQMVKDGVAHEGNIWDPSDQLLGHADWNRQLARSVLEVADVAREQNAHGFMGVDSLVVQDNGKRNAYFCEVNARWTGQQNGAGWAHRILGTTTPHDKCWAVKNIRVPQGTTPARFFSHLTRQRIFYDESKQTGVVPFNLATAIEEGKAMVGAMANNRGQLRDFLNKAEMHT